MTEDLLGGGGGGGGRKFSRGVRGHAPPENFENCNANRAILQHLGKNSLFFPC